MSSHRFFCVGPPKSGTTLLARLLDQHPKLCCMMESYALHPGAPNSLFHPASNKWRQHGFTQDQVGNWRRWSPLLPFRLPPRDVGGRSAVARYLQLTLEPALMDFAARCNAEAAGDKWPWYSWFIEPLRAAFPGARFIYTVRDPRALWNSAQHFRQGGRGDSFLQTALATERHIAEQQSRPDLITVRYEDLVQSPQQTMSRLYSFLEVSDFRLPDYDPNRDPYPERWSWIKESVEPPNPHHTAKWRTQMPPTAIAKVTASTSAFRAKYAYPE